MSWFSRMRNIVKGERVNTDLDDEFQFHLAAKADDLVRQGLTPEQARAEARRQFGNALVFRDSSRDIKLLPGVRALQAAIQDLRHGVRLLGRSPGFTLLAVASLAISLGGGIALFTLMNAALFRPLQGVDTGDIHQIYTSNSNGRPYGGSSYADLRSFTSLAPDLFAASAASTNVRANIEVDRRPLSVAGAVVSGGYFDLLRLSPERGRLLSRSDEEATGRTPAVVISYTFWRNRLAGDPAAIGAEIAVNGAAAVIVGVAPRGFAGLSFDSGAEFWAAPLLAATLLPPGTLRSRGARRFAVFARLRDGVPSTQAAARLSTVAEQLRVEAPAAWTDVRGATRKVTIVREVQSRFAGAAPGATREIAVAALGAIFAIVALACVNLATMVMARGAARTREINVRLALGASRGRVLRQLLVESLLIAVPSGALGLLGVLTALKLFNAYRPTAVPSFNLAVDSSVVAFAALIAIAASLLFGLAPGVHAIRLAIAEGLKGRPAVIRRRWLRAGPRELLLVVQVTASFALLVVASLFTRSLIAEGSEVGGRSTANIAVVSIDLNTASPAEGLPVLVDRLLRAADGVPGVDRSTAAVLVPLTGSSMGFSGRIAERSDAPEVEFDGNVVAPGYFEMIGTPLRAGRAFDGRDHDRAPRVAVVSESLARRLWGTPAVVGRTLSVDDHRAVEVIGVVADVPYRSTTDPVQPVIYLPIAQVAQSRFVLHTRMNDDAEVLVALDRALRAVDARIVVGTPTSMRRFMDRALAPAVAAQWIGGAAGLLQFGLALMALWGLVAYAAERRTAEIGLRLALGASRAAIAQLVMRPSVSLVLAGIVMGCVAGVGAAMVLHSEVVGLAPIELVAAIPAAVIFTAIAAVAAWIPARRATAIDPASALRQQ